MLVTRVLLCFPRGQRDSSLFTAAEGVARLQCYADVRYKTAVAGGRGGTLEKGQDLTRRTRSHVIQT